MSIETEIVARLEDDAGVGAEAGDRIYLKKLPQNPTYPAVVYRSFVVGRLHHLGGVSGWAVKRFQFDCWAKTEIAADALETAVRASLDGFTGKLTTIKATIRSDSGFSDHEDKTELYRVSQDYIIGYNE